MLYLLGSLFVIFSVLQGRFLFRKKLFGEFWFSLIIIGISFFYSVNFILHWNLPDPSTVELMLFKPLAELVFGSLN